MHIIFLDALSKLAIKKDSTILLALSLKQTDHQVYLVFEDDLYFSNDGLNEFRVFDFSGEIDSKSFGIKSFELRDSLSVKFDSKTTLHMRLDPPFDTRYLRFLWVLNAIKKNHGVQIINSADGILLNNEKIIAYEQKSSVPSYVGASANGFLSFLNRNSINDSFILKPVDLFQGIGVEKIEMKDKSESDLINIFTEKVAAYNGAVVIQPFIRDVEKGEIRSLYYNGKHLGSILKVPPKGQFLANIAQGASFYQVELEKSVENECERIAKELSSSKVPWVAYDILGGNIQEINITCPGLLVEVSKACGKNLALDIIDMF